MTASSDDNLNTEERILCAHSEGRISKIEAFEALQDLCGFEELQAKALLEGWIKFVAEQDAVQ